MLLFLTCLYNLIPHNLSFHIANIITDNNTYLQVTTLLFASDSNINPDEILIHRNILVLFAVIFSICIILIGVLFIFAREKNRYTKELLNTKSTLLETNMDLEAHTEELMASQEELDNQFQLLQKNKKEMQFLANHDTLTGYMRPSKFLSQLDLLIKKDTKFYVLYLTLTNLKDAANSLGYDLYESLIKIISKNLISQLGENHTYGIIKGDDFVIALECNEDELNKNVEKLIALFEEPFYSDLFSINLFVKIGISAYPNFSSSSHQIVRQSGIAAMSLLEHPSTIYTFYSQQMMQRIIEEQMIQAEIDIALNDQQFILYYQPKIDIHSTIVTGFEALIRWPLADGNMRSPGLFIPLAEKNGKTLAIGEFVMENVCRFISKYQLDQEGIHVSLNLSSQHFESDKIVEQLVMLSKKYKIAPNALQIELTESSLIKNYAMTERLLNQLRKEGFIIALDDFGTGYSSLSYLRDLPIDILKIDQSFIHQLHINKYMLILKNIIRLSKDLHYKINIEGVETQDQLDMLKPLQPDELQGYYFSKPLPENEAIAYLRKMNKTK